MSTTKNSSECETSPSKRGELQVIFGPMFSGKTSELLRRIRRFQIRNDSCILLKTKDSRYDNDNDKVVTHDLFNYLEAISCDCLFEVEAHAEDCDIIGIDEGQFFPDIGEFAEEMANRGKVVIVACLDSDFRREPFGNICNLVAKAETVTKLTSICLYCKGEASFSARISEEIDIKVIGGQDSISQCAERATMIYITISSNKLTQITLNV